MPKPKQPKSETKYLKVTVTGNATSRKTQWGLLNSFADMKVEGLTIDDIVELLKKLKIWADVTRENT